MLRDSRLNYLCWVIQYYYWVTTNLFLLRTNEVFRTWDGFYLVFNKISYFFDFQVSKLTKGCQSKRGMKKVPICFEATWRKWKNIFRYLRTHWLHWMPFVRKTGNNYEKYCIILEDRWARYRNITENVIFNNHLP